MGKHIIWKVAYIDGEDYSGEDYSDEDHAKYYFEKQEDAKKVRDALNEWFELGIEGQAQYACVPIYLNDSADSILDKYSDITKKNYTVSFYINGFIDVNVSQHTATPTNIFPMILFEDSGSCIVHEVPYNEDKKDVILEARIFAENHTLHKFDWNEFQKALTEKELNSWINLKNKIMKGKKNG